MKTERARLTLAPREVILSKLSNRAKESSFSRGIKENKSGSFCLDTDDENPDIADGDTVHWYGLIDTSSLMTSITAVLINFKRDYISMTYTGKEATSAAKLTEIIIDFDGVEIDKHEKEAVDNVVLMLLKEYNPKVV